MATIAESNKYLQSKTDRIKCAIKDAIASAKVEGIEVSKEFKRELVRHAIERERCSHSETDSVLNFFFETEEERVAAKEHLEEVVQKTEIINKLIKHRLNLDFSPEKLMKKTGWTEEKWREFESSYDEDLKYVDVVKYLNALGKSLVVTLSELETLRPLVWSNF